VPGGPASNRRYSIGEMHCVGIGAIWQKILEPNCLYNIFTICIQENSSLYTALTFFTVTLRSRAKKKLFFTDNLVACSQRHIYIRSPSWPLFVSYNGGGFRRRRQTISRFVSTASLVPPAVGQSVGSLNRRVGRSPKRPTNALASGARLQISFPQERLSEPCREVESLPNLRDAYLTGWNGCRGQRRRASPVRR
jgi:hypothetical protein